MNKKMISSAAFFFCLVPLGLTATPENRDQVKPEAELKAETTARLAEMEKRIQALERSMVEKDARIAELREKLNEAQTDKAERSVPNVSPREMDNFRGQLERFDQEFDQMYRRMFPEEGRGRAFRFDRRNTPALPFFGAPGSKPRLGVSLADVSAELRERHKNNVQAGAFIVQVVPESVADKAGLKAGDCVTAFGQKDIRSAQDLIQAVNDAAPGEYDLTVMRGGAALSVKVELGEKPAESPDAMLGAIPGFGQRQSGWWRQGPAPNAPMPPAAPVPGPDANAKIESKSAVEIQAGVLEMTNELALALKLNADQRNKMDKILAESRRKLNELLAHEPASKAADAEHVRELLKGQIADAEKSLAEVLSAEQIKTWRNFRETRDSLTIMVRREQREVRSSDGNNEGF